MSYFRACSGRDMSPVEVGWVAGLLEGEGSFMLLNRHDGTTSAPRISMQSTDHDVLERLQSTTGVGTICKVGQRGTRKPCWQWGVSVRADCEWLMELLLPLMGDRRGSQICVALQRAEVA